MADVVRADGPRLSFTCPGCKSRHTIMTAPSRPGTPVWHWNGSKDRPTINPSILVTGYDEIDKEDFVCHSFIADGEIRFLGDCTHDLANMTVPLRVDK